jgi:putative transposase
LINENQVIAIESLSVSNMQKNRCLSKSISDASWSEFVRQLEYKLAWCGGRVIAVPPQNTSRTCPQCGHVTAENRPSQARFCCVQCGYEAHADLVAAINIRRAGHARMACGSNGSSRRKQEPTEVAQAVA